MIYRLKDKGSLVEPNNRVLVNSGPVSILVKNFPEDPDKKARLKTSIALMAESAANKLRSIDAQVELASTIELLKPCIHRQMPVFDEILAQQKQQKTRVMQLVDQLAQRFEADFLALRLFFIVVDLLVKVRNAFARAKVGVDGLCQLHRTQTLDDV